MRGLGASAGGIHQYPLPLPAIREAYQALIALASRTRLASSRLPLFPNQGRRRVYPRPKAFLSWVAAGLPSFHLLLRVGRRVEDLPGLPGALPST